MPDFSPHLIRTSPPNVSSPNFTSVRIKDTDNQAGGKKSASRQFC